MHVGAAEVAIMPNRGFRRSYRYLGMSPKDILTVPTPSENGVRVADKKSEPETHHQINGVEQTEIFPVTWLCLKII